MQVEYELTPRRREQLYRFYFDEWWTRERTVEEADAALAASYVALVVDEDDVVGFARAVSDGVIFAWVGDVIAAPDRRGSGVGAAIMDGILAHPALQRVRKWELGCQPDLVDFYARWGFGDLAPSRGLRRSTTQRW